MEYNSVFLFNNSLINSLVYNIYENHENLYENAAKARRWFYGGYN